MRKEYAFSFRFGEQGRIHRFRIGRFGLAVIAGVTALLFILTTLSLYEYRETSSRVRELRALRDRVSRQNLSLYNLNEKFESLETEVERLRTIDARVKSLVKVTETLLPGGGKKGQGTGVGGSEKPETTAAGRIDRLLDLRWEQLRTSVLADVRNLEAVCEKLDQRRIYLESRPVFRPLRGIVTSPFGVRLSPFTGTQVFHEGLDIESSTGTTVRAAARGRVVRSGYEALYGNLLVVDHGNGFRTLYAHLSECLASAGDLVQKGDVIGKVGDTGRTTGPHLHYEVRVNGLPVNPTRFFQ